MEERDFMNQAIAELEKCAPQDPARHPRVGAVVVRDNKVIATGHRGEHDHAETQALDQIDLGEDLSQATIYTTLEPCTGLAGREPGESCTERIKARNIKKVVVGILDPNQGLSGKGLLQLQDRGIEVSLFPHDLAQQIRQLNEAFIKAQPGHVMPTKEKPGKPTIEEEAEARLADWNLRAAVWYCVYYALGIIATGLVITAAAKPPFIKAITGADETIIWLAALVQALATFLISLQKASAYRTAWRTLKFALIDHRSQPQPDAKVIKEAIKRGWVTIDKGYAVEKRTEGV
jgi:pyrimidine deaminase RibD-like protein